MTSVQRELTGRGAALTRAVAVVGLVVLGLDVTLANVLPTAGVLAAALFPVWAVALGSYPGARPVLALTLAALASGLVLVLLPGAHDIQTRYAIATATRTLAVVLGLGFVLWCRWFLRFETVALCYGVGALLIGVSHVPGSANSWKYQLALPVAIVLLSTAQRIRGRSGILAVLGSLVVLGAVSVVHDYRSFFGFTALTALVVGWQGLRAGRRTRVRRARTTIVTWVASGVVLALTGYALYRAAEQLLLSGALGQVLQERSQAQVRAAGSLLVGGRPEWAGTLRLMLDSPAGFGPGAVPTSHDVLVAKEGLATVGVSPTNGYVDNYMFGGQFRLHSTIADAWSNFGWVGVVLALLLGGLLVHALLTGLAEGTTSALTVLLGLRALWDLAFGPMYSNLPEIGLALALALRPRTARPDPLSSRSSGPAARSPVGVGG